MQQQVHRRAGAIELFRQQSSATPTTHWHLILPRTHDLRITVFGGQRAVLRGTPPQLLADAGDGLRIELDLPGKFEHEGEATLHLRRGEQDLYALAFTLGDIAGQRVAYVGALQGLRSPDALET